MWARSASGNAHSWPGCPFVSFPCQVRPFASDSWPTDAIRNVAQPLPFTLQSAWSRSAFGEAPRCLTYRIRRRRRQLRHRRPMFHRAHVAYETQFVRAPCAPDWVRFWRELSACKGEPTADHPGSLYIQGMQLRGASSRNWMTRRRAKCKMQLEKSAPDECIPVGDMLFNVPPQNAATPSYRSLKLTC